MKKTDKQGFKANKHFFRKGARHLGFEGLSRLLELVDNSIDAEADHINIKYTSNKNTKTKNIVIEDSGRGFDPKKFYDAIMVWGDTREYDNTDIGNFGIGMSAVFNEVIQSGGEIKIETSNGDVFSEADLYIDEKDNEVTFDYEQNKQAHNSGIPHTMIKMTNVKTDLTIENLIKHLKVIYYPTFVNNPDFKIYIEGDKNKQIKFVDPMYRDITDESNVCKTYNKTFNYKGQEIDILVKAFYTDFVSKYENRLKDWDKVKGKKESNWLPITNSGLYLRYNGRYINVGNRLMPGNDHGGHNYTGLRFEIKIPKTIEDFPINVNKSKVTFDKSNTDLQDLYRVIKSIKSEYNRDYNKTKGGNSTMSEEDLQKIQLIVNKLVQDTGVLRTMMNKFGGNTGVQKRKRTKVKQGTIRPKGSGIKRTGNQWSKAFEPNILKNGVMAPFYTWEKENGTAVLTLNEDSELYKLWLNQGIEAIASLCFQLYCQYYAVIELSNGTSDSEREEQILNDYDELVLKMTLDSNKYLKS